MNLIRWIEISAYNFERAVSFYSYVFGLEIQTKLFNGIPHGVFTINSGTLSGAIVKSDGLPMQNAGPVLFFGVISMEETLKRILDSKGIIEKEKTLITNKPSDGISDEPIPKTFIDNHVGFYAVFRDSEGNKMALYSHS
jgi:predicted enzyme related to lactoylglutathione lyase